MPSDHSTILTVNAGSSSLKFALFERPGIDRSALERVLSGKIERIGLQGARASIARRGGQSVESTPVTAADLGAAAEVVVELLEKEDRCASLAAVGHRIVHGGPRYYRPELITDDLITELRRISILDVDHLPAEIELIERFVRLTPRSVQVACFDTGFHHDLPRVAQIVAIPRRFERLGVRRYGFHGLSYAYLKDELTRLEGSVTANGRVIFAHLGSGASLAAVHHGRSVDTTMGLTPASGLVMGTRSGDIDPALPFFITAATGATPEEFQSIVNHESGLIGVSETSPDFRDLLEREKDDVRAAEAVALFVYQTKKAIGALAAAMGGLDMIVFSGGIGENSTVARERICDGLEFLGVQLDANANESGEPIISARGAGVKVRVIPTDEELMIARSVSEMLSHSPIPTEMGE
jgi:acetate kinase